MQPGLGEFEMEDPEILRDASHDPTELDPEADAAFDLPRMTPVSGRSGSRRNSASRSLPSRNGSNPPPSPAVDRDGGGEDAAPVPLEDLAPPPDADAPMPDVDFEPPNFDAPMFDEDDQNVDNNVQTEVGEEARTPLKRGRDSVADADGAQLQILSARLFETLRRIATDARASAMPSRTSCHNACFPQRLNIEC